MILESPPPLVMTPVYSNIRPNYGWNPAKLYISNCITYVILYIYIYIISIIWPTAEVGWMAFRKWRCGKLCYFNHWLSSWGSYYILANINVKVVSGPTVTILGMLIINLYLMNVKHSIRRQGDVPLRCMWTANAAAQCTGAINVVMAMCCRTRCGKVCLLYTPTQSTAIYAYITRLLGIGYYYRLIKNKYGSLNRFYANIWPTI